jgi:hypothetical protein
MLASTSRSPEATRVCQDASCFVTRGERTACTASQCSRSGILLSILGWAINICQPCGGSLHHQEGPQMAILQQPAH